MVQEGDRLDVVARLTSRSFGGYESLQLDIRDVATSGSHREAATILRSRGIPFDQPALTGDQPALAGSAS